MSLQDKELCLCGHGRHSHASQTDNSPWAYLFRGRCQCCACRGFLKARRHRWLNAEDLARVGIEL